MCVYIYIPLSLNLSFFLSTYLPIYLKNMYVQFYIYIYIAKVKQTWIVTIPVLPVLFGSTATRYTVCRMHHQRTGKLKLNSQGMWMLETCKD